MSEPRPRLTALSKMVQTAGYRASIEENLISTSVGGIICLVFYLDNWDNLQFYAAYNRTVSATFGHEEANRFCQKYRFGKCYLTEDNINFEADFLFDIDSNNAQLHLNRIFAQWEMTVSNARRALRDDWT